jgi:hypothetical protein
MTGITRKLVRVTTAKFRGDEIVPTIVAAGLEIAIEKVWMGSRAAVVRPVSRFQRKRTSNNHTRRKRWQQKNSRCCECA